MCNSKCSVGHERPVPVRDSAWTFDNLVTNSTHKPKYCVMFHQYPSSHREKKHCQEISIRRIDDTYQTKQACVKGSKVPPGCAVCCGTFEGDCPFMFVSGGDGKRAKEIWSFDFLLGKWEKLGDMKTQHSGHRMHCVNKKLYMIAGESDGIIEMYDAVKPNKKDKIVPGRSTHVRACLKVKVHDAPSVVYQDIIFLFGGMSDSGPVKCVQYFDTQTGSVGELPDLPCECHGGEAIVVNNDIYIVTPHGPVVRFDPATDKSHICTNQPSSRRQFALVQRDNKLVIIGGESCDGHVRLPEYTYDLKTDEWTVTGVGQRSPLVATSCLVEYSRPCMFSPFCKDPYSHVPHRCNPAKL